MHYLYSIPSSTCLLPAVTTLVSMWWDARLTRTSWSCFKAARWMGFKWLSATRSLCKRKLNMATFSRGNLASDLLIQSPISPYGNQQWDHFTMYVCWSLWTLYLHACQVRGTVGDSGLCWCVFFRALFNSPVCIFIWKELYPRSELNCGTVTLFWHLKRELLMQCDPNVQ